MENIVLEKRPPGVHVGSEGWAGGQPSSNGKPCITGVFEQMVTAVFKSAALTPLSLSFGLPFT